MGNWMINYPFGRRYSKNLMHNIVNVNDFLIKFAFKTVFNSGQCPEHIDNYL